MICPPCREGSHSGCANLRKPGLTLPNWCDCQHQPGARPAEPDDSLGVTPGDPRPAAVHVTA